ncbi:hypothetical protein A1353_19685 [Methylomonas methanica]|uniref:DUF4145 domain-containing protein n=1 Tax=Methylomonas methanica TaxID=421 RepID=A0A177M470_METMH|nr:DUF4145 domain-containing protein [Methylomonas methanica]OAI00165.1 hypothetical protein A1353_19685 [Methylomonas methanica]
MTRLYKKRFDELQQQLVDLAATKQTKLDPINGSPYDYVDSETMLAWCVKTKNLLAQSCGEESQHFKTFEIAQKARGYEHNTDVLSRLRAVFSAAKEDYEGGYVASIRNLVQAEVFDSELEQASELLSAGYATAAAVIAGTVLETTLRNLCDANGIPHGKLDKMNADLAKAGVHSVLIQKQITAIAGIRNSAAHGKSTEFTAEDVRRMIDDINRYVTDTLA